MMEKKTFDFEVKKVEKNTFEGYASTYDLDLQGDTIEKGAFTKSLQERAVIVLYQHDSNATIGKVVEAKEDDTGLFIKAQISETVLGKDVMQLIKDGVLSKMSIGYDIKDFDPTENGRHLKELTLYEVSVVSFPANEATSILNAKSAFKEKTLRISGEKLNDYLSAFDDFFEEHPIEEGTTVIEVISSKEEEDFYNDMKSMFNLTIEEVS
jgi:HK97 family phage prohead protease